jgi:hypothetical protein
MFTLAAAAAPLVLYYCWDCVWCLLLTDSALLFVQGRNGESAGVHVKR